MKKITAKNNTTNGFLLCFRPFPMEEGSICTTDASTINNDDSDFNKSFSVIIEKPKSSSKIYSSDKESIVGNQKKTVRHRILSKIVKAMAFQSSLSKKVQKGKMNQDPFRTDFGKQKSRRRSSTSSSSSSSEENDLKIDSSISNSSILSSSSSSLSISSSSSIASSWSTSSSDSNRSFGSLSGRQKSFLSDSIEDEKKQTISSSIQSSTTDNKKKITGICLLLISLFVLIFWGKFFAILCTSTWFYFVSMTRRGTDGVDERRILAKSPVVFPSKEYKKKIIMEGFLERNHGGCFHLHQH